MCDVHMFLKVCTQILNPISPPLRRSTYYSECRRYIVTVTRILHFILPGSAVHADYSKLYEAVLLMVKNALSPKYVECSVYG